MRKRTLGRELALQVLYQLDLRGQEVMDELDACLTDASEEPDAEIIAFARELVTGYWERHAAIDEKIESAAKNWQLKSMAVIDRNILRLATYELLFREDIPPLVSINEASVGIRKVPRCFSCAAVDESRKAACTSPSTPERIAAFTPPRLRSCATTRRW